MVGMFTSPVPAPCHRTTIKVRVDVSLTEDVSSHVHSIRLQLSLQCRCEVLWTNLSYTLLYHTGPARNLGRCGGKCKNNLFGQVGNHGGVSISSIFANLEGTDNHTRLAALVGVGNRCNHHLARSCTSSQASRLKSAKRQICKSPVSNRDLLSLMPSFNWLKRCAVR